MHAHRTCQQDVTRTLAPPARGPACRPVEQRREIRAGGGIAPERSRDRSKAGSRLLGSVMKGCRSAASNGGQAGFCECRAAGARSGKRSSSRIADMPARPSGAAAARLGGSDGSRPDLRDDVRSADGGNHARGTIRRAADNALHAPPLVFRSPAFPRPDKDFVSDLPAPTASREAADFVAALRPQADDRRSARRSRRRARGPSDPPEWPGQGYRGRRKLRRRETGGSQNGRARSSAAAELGEGDTGSARRSRVSNPSRFFSSVARSLIALPGLGKA